MITKYLISNKQNQGLGTIGYNTEGVLVYFNFAGFKTAEQVDWMLTKLPMREVAVIKTIEKLSQYKLVVSKAPLDLSFEMVWAKYGHKVDKKDAEKAWHKLSEKKQIACFESFGKYEAYLTKSKVGKAYLSTYINKEYWENEY